MSAKDKIKKYEETEKTTADTEPANETVAPEKETVKTDSETDENVDTLREKLTAVQAESKTNYDQLLRVSAEFENYKKRTGRELDAFRKYATESLVKELLPVIDNLERAIESASDNSEANACVIEGVQMTYQELLKILEKFNVSPIEAMDKPFDPTFHQAILQEETADKPGNVVIKEMQRGYMMHDRLLRPAMVVVSKAPSPNDDAGVPGAASETEM